MSDDDEEVIVPAAPVTVDEMRAAENQVRAVMQFIPIKEKHVLFDRDEPVQHRVRINGTVSRTAVAEETPYRLSKMTISRGEDLRFSVVQEGSTDTYEWILHADITHKSKLDQSGNVVETKQTTVLPGAKLDRLGILIQFYTEKSTCQFQKLTIKGYPQIWPAGKRLNVRQLAMELPHNENFNTVLFNVFRSIRRASVEEVSLNVSAAVFVHIGKDKLLKRPALHLTLDKFHIQAIRDIQTKWCSLSVGSKLLPKEDWKELLEYYLTKKQAGWFLQIELDIHPYLSLHQLAAEFNWELRRFKDKVCCHQVARNNTEVVLYFENNYVVLETVNPGAVGKPLPKRFNLEIMNKIIAHLPIIERDMIKNDLFWEADIPSVYDAILVNFNKLELQIEKDVEKVDSELAACRRLETLFKHPKTITDSLIIYSYSEHFLNLPSIINVRILILIHHDPYPKEFFGKFNGVQTLYYASLESIKNVQALNCKIDYESPSRQIPREAMNQLRNNLKKQLEEDDKIVGCNCDNCVECISRGHYEQLKENPEVHGEDNPETVDLNSEHHNEPINEDHYEEEHTEEENEIVDCIFDNCVESINGGHSGQLDENPEVHSKDKPKIAGCICDKCVKQTTIDEPQENPEGYNEANTETYAPTFAHDLDRSRSPTPVYTRSGSPWLEELQSDEPSAKRSRLERSDNQPRYRHKGSKSQSPQRSGSMEIVENSQKVPPSIPKPIESPVPTPNPAIPELFDVNLLDLELPASIPRFLEEPPVFTQPELLEDNLGTLALELPTSIPRFIEEPLPVCVPRYQFVFHNHQGSANTEECFSPIYSNNPEEEYWEH
ncbi:hypothetical protein GCK72_016296 [Caenorhabditis remanei]|uniref:Uncharacterized protein n=1 Tax=Caenorhabditis remanei TaxID=31234 RepID=A0A6A5GYQ9_CAERE|nr:hypothetical protein GCK72_016296 [Caenorhabditis remanei]KAF1759829.1 hypothetical protein GCK72_016296 [Caenorhabditis remanei]